MGDGDKIIRGLEEAADLVNSEARRLAAQRARKTFRAIDGGKADPWPIYRRPEDRK